MQTHIEARPNLLIWLVGLPTLPILWIVLLGMITSMHVRAHWRPTARDIVSKCGGWSNMPAGVAVGAWRLLRRQPMLVWGTAGFVALVAMLLGGRSAIAPALAIALATIMAAPMIDDRFADMLKASGSRWLWPDDASRSRNDPQGR
jgi:hypothetical protein